jgi:drug/metabolite transporter (DMT)-like permease
VIIFSGSLPATRVAVAGFTPLFLTSARAVIAALLGAMLLMALKQKRPAVSDLGSLGLVALGVVIGFPLLTALALQHITAAHSVVFIGLLPLATAIFGVLRGGERPKLAFWFFSVAGSLLVAGVCSGARRGRVARWRPPDGSGGRGLRVRLRRRSDAVASAWRMAGDSPGHWCWRCRSWK